MNQKQFKHKKVEEISPNVYWINGGSSNLYLCVEEAGLTLVDTGMSGREKLVFEVVSGLGYQSSDIKQILVTHADPDHVGSLAPIQRRSGAVVYASEATAVHLINGTMPKHLPSPIQFIAERFMSIKPIDKSVIKTVTDGDTLPILGGLSVVATPGHTADHHSFFSRLSGVLFSGDALHTRNGPIRPSSDFISADRRQVIQSARRLLTHSPAVVASGHGRPSTDHSSDDLMRLYNQFRVKEANL